jgi:RNA polymerase sigma-70 factor, ECF subfamily
LYFVLYRSLANFRGESKLSTWLYRIATNAALDRLRKPVYQRIVKKGLWNTRAEDVDAEIEDRNAWTGERIPLLEEQVFRKEMNECIQEFIVKLPKSYRAILVLSEFEDLRNKEIAEILTVSLETVKIRLHRARERLKKELGDNCDSYWIENNEFVPELKPTKK